MVAVCYYVENLVGSCQPNVIFFRMAHLEALPVEQRQFGVTIKILAPAGISMDHLKRRLPRIAIKAIPTSAPNTLTAFTIRPNYGHQRRIYTIILFYKENSFYLKNFEL